MSPATLLCLLMCLWPCSVLCQQGGLCLGPFEEGEPFTLSYTNPLATDIIVFQKKVDNEFVNVSACTLDGNCQDFLLLNYVSRINVTEDRGPIMSLSIFSGRINDTVFRCLVDTSITPPICVEMYVRPTKPACQPPIFVNSNTQISIRCRTDKVYPDALLEAKMYHIDPTDSLQAEVECTKSPSLTYPGYYATACTALFPLSAVKPRTYRFYLAMYPRVSNLTVALGRKVESDQIASMVLTAPEVRLSSDCPTSNYIVSGMCTCELTTKGNPPAQAKWYTQTGQELLVGTETLEDGSSRLNVTYHPSDPTPTYDCRADTALDVSPPSTVSFSPLFAFGPNSITIEASDDGKFDLCPPEERLTKVTCKIPLHDVEPAARMTITVNGDAVVEKQEGKIFGNQYIQEYSFRPPRGGNYAVICRAENSISSQLSMSKSLTLEVRQPSISSPVFVIPGNDPGSNVSTVILGKTIDITCKVDGGQPRVSEVTITCGSRRQQVPDNIGALTLEVTPSLDGQPCYCTATHDSGCYDKVSEVFLKVEEADDVKNELSLAPIVGVSVGGVVIIAVIVVVVIIILFKRRAPATDQNTDDVRTRASSTHRVPSDDYLTPIPTDSGDYTKPADDVTTNEEWSYNNPSFSHYYDTLDDVFDSTN